MPQQLKSCIGCHEKRPDDDSYRRAHSQRRFIICKSCAKFDERVADCCEVSTNCPKTEHAPTAGGRIRGLNASMTTINQSSTESPASVGTSVMDAMKAASMREREVEIKERLFACLKLGYIRLARPKCNCNVSPSRGQPPAGNAQGN